MLLRRVASCGVPRGVAWRNRLRGECGSHAREEMESLQGQTPDCNAFLQLVDQKWQDHCASMLTLRNIFLYLDRSFVLQTPSLRSIWDMGLELFRNDLQVRGKLCYRVQQRCTQIVSRALRTDEGRLSGT